MTCCPLIQLQVTDRGRIPPPPRPRFCGASRVLCRSKKIAIVATNTLTARTKQEYIRAPGSPTNNNNYIILLFNNKLDMAMHTINTFEAET